MTEIDKLIEKEAERHISQFNTFEYKEYDDLISLGYEGTRISNDANQLRDRAFMNGFKSGASFILHQNRWRNVEEELPEVKEFGLKVLIRIIEKPKSVAFWEFDKNTNIDIFKKLGSEVEWKYIE